MVGTFEIRIEKVQEIYAKIFSKINAIYQLIACNYIWRILPFILPCQKS